MKAREYAPAGPVRRQVIVESASVGLRILQRQASGQKWTVTTIVAGDLLPLPDISIEILVDAIYEGIDFPPP